MRPTFSLGDMLRKLRTDKGLTQAELARRLGLTGNAVISRLERGGTLPSAALSAKLAKVLGVEPALLATRMQRESRGSTATALLADLSAAFDGARRELDEELESLRRSLGQHQSRIAHVLALSELQLLWGLPDKLAYEATVHSAWVVTPDLMLDVQSAPVRDVVEANVQRGVAYRYLVPPSPGVLSRARRFLKRFGPAAPVEVRSAPADGLMFLSELVLYDALTPRRLGLMIAPTARSDVDCVLSPVHAARLARGFQEAWRSATPVG